LLLLLLLLLPLLLGEVVGEGLSYGEAELHLAYAAGQV
jgi:hypothetical protein